MKNYARILSNLFTDKVNRWFLSRGKSFPSLVESEAREWKCYLYLKEKYHSFLSSLPRYTVQGKTPKIIWWCWLQGETQAPAICKAGLSSIYKHFSDFDVRIISNENINQYISIPEYISEKHNKGIIPHPQFSDIIRSILLTQYGGVWIDSTVYCTGYHFPVLNQPLFVFQNWKFNQHRAILASNWLIASCPSHPIIRTTLDLLLEYWKNNNELIDYFLFHLLFHLAVEEYPQLWNDMSRYSNIPPHILQYELFDSFNQIRFEEIKAMSDFHKLNWKVSDHKENPNSYYQHLLSSV